MDLQRITGLTHEQLTDITTRVHLRLGPLIRPGGRPAALGLYRSTALVVALHRHNLTQELAGAAFSVSQATVSRRWD
ncbi:helix-turn-helix domain-containing protein [Nocardiopsis nanhaiensis]